MRGSRQRRVARVTSAAGAGQVTCDFSNCQRFAEFSVGLFGKAEGAFPNQHGDECAKG